MRSGLLDLFSAMSGRMPILEWLDTSAYDELLEFDIPNNHYRILDHVDDKYADAPEEGAYTDLCQFVVDCLVHPDDRESYKRFMDPDTLLERLRRPGKTGVTGVLVNQMRFKTNSGNWRWVEMCLVDGFVHGLKPGIVRFYLFDIQVQKDRNDADGPGGRSTQPSRDQKTGLLWGMSFFDKAGERYAEIDKSQWCVIVMDLDHFSLFNEWYGRDTGDMLLSMVGKELLLAERATNGLAGYLGQDDFCLLVPYDEGNIDRFYVRVSEIVARLATGAGFKPLLGISAFDEDVSFMDAFDQARWALEAARQDFKTDICLYNPQMRERDEREYRVLIDFQRGLKENEFVVYLQPQCRVSTGKIVAVEALSRWIKSDGTIVPPDQFIPILERHGFITDLDCFVWDSLCARVRAEIDAGHQVVPVSVNVSQHDFFAIDVPQYFAELLRRYDIPESLLKVEITESAFVEGGAEVEKAIKQLRDMGIMVWMDDFGAGYSSLNRLGDLDIDGIKLDAAFFRTSEEDKRKSIRIVESIINMAKTMALPIICEGVETEGQVEFLDGLGCRYIQGFYYYRPMPIPDFVNLVEDGSMADERGFVVKTNAELQIREFLDENVYSDAMLNTILGPVAFYLWHDDTIDIIRFNERFYEAVNVPDFNERLVNVPQFVPPSEVPKLFDLFARAEEDKLNGAADIVAFYKSSGKISQFIMRLYYLGENDEGKRFYGSVRDVTEVVELGLQLKMLSDHLPLSVVFARRFEDKWTYKPIIHGLAGETGLSIEQLQRELDDDSFFQRFDQADYERLKASLVDSLSSEKEFTDTFTFTGEGGKRRRFKLEAKYAGDFFGESSHFLIASAIE